MKRIIAESIVTQSRAIRALLTAVLAGGCGAPASSPSDPGTNRTASVMIQVDWPERTSRLIPIASNSIRVKILGTDGQTVLTSQILNRPVEGGSSRAFFIKLPAGGLYAVATAYPQAAAQGTPQAEAEGTLLTHADETTQLSLTMNSSITQVTAHTLSGATSATLSAGQTIDLIAEPKDNQGRLVVTSPSTWTWHSTNTTDVNLSPQGSRVTVAAAPTIPKQVTVAVSAKETESQKSGQATLNVPAGSGGITGNPEMYGDYRVNFVVTYGPGLPYSVRGTSDGLTISLQGGGTFIIDDVDGDVDGAAHYLTCAGSLKSPLALTLTSSTHFTGIGRGGGKTCEFQGDYLGGRQLQITGHGTTGSDSGFQYYDVTFTCTRL